MALQSDVEQAGLISDDDRSRKQSELVEEEQSQVAVVKWENFRAPIPVDHRTFMRKVFLTLTLQLMVTAGILALCIYNNDVRLWIMTNDWLYFIGLFGMVCILCALMFNVGNYPINVVLLCLFTVFMAFMVGTITAAYATYYGAELVMQAFLMTVLIFIALALFASCTRCNLMPLGLFAFMVLNALCWWGMFAWFWGWYSSSWMSLMFVIVFCCYILFDVWRMCNMPVFNASAWIPAAINLYLDVINLFLWLLRLLARSRR